MICWGNGKLSKIIFGFECKIFDFGVENGVNKVNKCIFGVLECWRDEK